ncbi:MAG: cytidylate kinase-like family protein [Bacteroidales bacterium]|nr:cytidylate kinase-like family protein [Bacteroidales bacterium]
MENHIMEYFQKRYQQQLIPPVRTKAPGPVLTISRECGCEGTALARQLALRLNEYYLPIGCKSSWEVISKKILEAAAQELKTQSENIKFIFDSEQRTMWEDFMQSVTSKEYHSEWKIKNAIKNVIRDFATEGYSIILGRGGAQITRDIEKALHVKLVAPVQWRAERFMEKHDLSKAVALARIKEIDNNRDKLIKMLYAGCSQELCYDITYNVEKFSTGQLVLDIIHLMQQKKLI